MKAVAVHAVFIVAVIVIFIFFLAAIFFEWIDVNKLGTNQATCRMKLMNYCNDLIKTGKEPFNWNTKEPLGCENSGITQPDKIKCQEILG